MWSRLVPAFVSMIGLLALWGCGRVATDSAFVSRPEPWRAVEEEQCLASGFVRPTPFRVEHAALGGPGHCGAARPFEVSAALGGRVALRPTALLRCPMIPAVDHWMQTIVLPAAERHFRQPVIELKVAASYACRPTNHVWGARLSEHGHANALDVSAFQLASGEWVTVKGGWHSRDGRERGFLREVHQGACHTFTTVLGPNYDANHRDHFHLDLARHGRDGQMRICK